MLEGRIIEDNTANRMRALNLLNLFAQGIGVLNLISQPRNIHPMMLDDAFDELFLARILPEKHGVGPFILGAVFGDLIANFVQVVDDLHRVFLDVGIIADFEEGYSLGHFYLFFLHCFFHWVLLSLHSFQNLLSFFLVNFVHFVLDFCEAAHHIVHRTDDFTD